MICPKCGNENDDTQKQCQTCGSKLTPKAKKINKKTKIIIGFVSVMIIVFIIGIASAASNSSNQDSTDDGWNNYSEDYTYTTEYTTIAETTTEKPKLSANYTVLASGTEDNGDTYELVATQEESYNDVVIKIGVIKNNEWLVPLTTDIPFINEDGSITYYKHEDGSGRYYQTKNLDDLETDKVFIQIESFSFVGNGCFFGYSEDLSRRIFVNYPLYEIIYNAELGKACKTQAYYNSSGGGLSYANAFCVKTSEKEYINSNKIVFHNYSEDYYHNDFDVNILNTDTMTVNTIIDKTITEEWVGSDSIIGPLSDGLFAVGNNYDITGFYDEEGNNVIDMSEYDVDIHKCADDNGEYPYFKNGQFKFVTKNEAESKYQVVIDKTGKVLSSTKLEESN